MSLEYQISRSMHDITLRATAAAAVLVTIIEEPGRDWLIGAGTLPEICNEADANFILSFEMRLLSRLRSPLVLVENI